MWHFQSNEQCNCNSFSPWKYSTDFKWMGECHLLSSNQPHPFKCEGEKRSLQIPALQAGGQHSSQPAKIMDWRASDFSDLLLSGWDSGHAANAPSYQTEPTGLLSPFLWSVESCSTERNIFEHDKHLIMVLNFTRCLPGLTGNEEGKSISCCFIRYLQ